MAVVVVIKCVLPKMLAPTPQSLVLPRWSTPWTESEAYCLKIFLALVS